MTEEHPDPATDGSWVGLVFCLVLVGAAAVWLWKMWPD